MMELKHSGVGISSFVLAIIGFVSMFILLVAAGALSAVTPGGLSENSIAAAVIGLLIMILGIFNLIALGLGIGGLCQGNRKKVFAIIGTALSALTLILTIALIIIGSMLP